jgi:hypothetical protein
MSIVDKIKAYKAAVAPVVSKDTVLRYPLSTADALALCAELKLDAPGAKELAAVGAEPDSVEAKITHYAALSQVAKQFWRELVVSVDGVEVVRGS